MTILLALALAIAAAAWRIVPVDHGPLWADVGITVFGAVMVGVWLGRREAT